MFDAECLPDDQPAHAVPSRSANERSDRGGQTLLAAVGTPSIASRSLGRLPGLQALQIKLEVSQPTGSWLDRSAAALVQSALGEGWSGLGAIGLPVWSLPLAVQCARAGLRLVFLTPTQVSIDADSGDRSPAHLRGWLTTLGAQIVEVDASADALCAAGPAVLRCAGLRPVADDDPLLGSGLLDVVGEIEAAGFGERVLVVPEFTGFESASLASAAEQRARAVPLPLDGLAPSGANWQFALVGALRTASGRDVSVGAAPAGASAQNVLTVGVSVREAEAARRLLAREEGLLVSSRGAASFAALVRTLHEDRSRRPRERLLRDVRSAVIVVTGESPGLSSAPPVAPDSVRARPVTLAALSADLSRLLVQPPGR